MRNKDMIQINRGYFELLFRNVRIVDNSFPHLAKQRYSILFNAATTSEPYNPKRIKLKPFGNSPIYVRNVDFRELHIENPYKELVD